MRRRLLAAVAATALLVSGALAGCGIPDETDVQVDGRGPSPYSGPAGGQGSKPPERMDSEDPAQFALNFLQAAAGEAGQAYERVKSFIAPDSRDQLREKQGNEIIINVVRLVEDTPQVTVNPSTSKVTIRVQQVGVLRTNGTLGPPVATASEYVLTLGRVQSAADGKTEAGLYVLDPPDVLLMNVHALNTYYRSQIIYFWSTDRAALVPDRRYLPASVPQEGQATEVLGWLTGGPADWLQSTVVGLPDGTKVIGNVPQTDGRLEVNLSAPSGPVNEDRQLDLLATQLVWSLPDLHGELELKIRNQSRKLVNIDDYRRATPVYSIVDPERFCVYAGEVHALSSDVGQAGRPVPIAPAANRNVVAAGITRIGPTVAAALVTATGGKRRLMTGSDLDQATNFKAGVPYGSMGRPVWLKGMDPTRPTGLVVADGRLYRFDMNARLSELRVPDVAAPLSAVGAALDGRRIAVVAGGELYVAPLIAEGAALTVGPARPLNISLGEPTAVEWSGEDSLVVAGKANRRMAIYRVTIDAAIETPLVNDAGASVNHLAAYPSNPIIAPSVSRVMYEANGVAWADHFSTFERISATEVEGAGTSAGGTSANPTAPFFLY